MIWHCETCNQDLDSARGSSTSNSWRCPNCGAQVRLTSTEVSPPPGKPTRIAEPELHESADTVFQPGLMMESIMDELETEPQSAKSSPAADQGTEQIEADPAAMPAPHLQLDVEPFLLILGATPGQEKRPLILAKTVFGRQGADIPLDDPAVSGAHFQIEAFGKEFFLRDLDSSNGTFLNGSKIRYSQLLPGDQITAGKTSLIFRTSDDLIDRGSRPRPR